MSRVVISLCGRKRTGKESAFKLIQQYVDHPEEFQFATPLKKFCIEVLGLTHDHCYGTSADRESPTKYLWGGVAEAIREKWNKDPKEVMTARDVLQVVGTDLMRQGLYKDVWAEGGIREAIRSSAKTCIYTDTRFPNEVRVTKETSKMDPAFGPSLLIRLYRETGLTDSHDSETALDCYDLYPNQRRIHPNSTHMEDYGRYKEKGYERVDNSISLFRGSPGCVYDYLIDNNHTLDVLRNNMLFILKEHGIYSEPTCS
jgi:hypothetical protein